jgi:hypothetical protein
VQVRIRRELDSPNEILMLGTISANTSASLVHKVLTNDKINLFDFHFKYFTSL